MAALNWPLHHVYLGYVWGIQHRLGELVFLNKIDNMDIKIGFEMCLIVVEAIRGRCASFMILTATVSEIFGGQTNSSILVGPSIGPSTVYRLFNRDIHREMHASYKIFSAFLAVSNVLT